MTRMANLFSYSKVQFLTVGYLHSNNTFFFCSWYSIVPNASVGFSFCWTVLFSQRQHMTIEEDFLNIQTHMYGGRAQTWWNIMNGHVCTCITAHSPQDYKNMCFSRQIH